MDTSTLITQSYSDRPVLAEVKVIAIVMVVRGYPSNPDRGRILTSKDPH